MNKEQADKALIKLWLEKAEDAKTEIKSPERKSLML